jgi:general secretion pathway protein D
LIFYLAFTLRAGRSTPQSQIKSSAAVQNGEGIMLAGLITERREQAKSGVFELTNLPLVDGLFGKIVNVFERTEPVVLLSHDNG